MDLETAVASDIAVVIAAPAFPGAGRRSEEDPADHPGIVDRLAVRPDHPAFHGDASAETHVDLPVPDVRLQVEQDIGMRIRSLAAGQAFLDHPAANGLEHVIVIGGHDGEIARAGRGPELKRAIGVRVLDGAPAG